MTEMAEKTEELDATSSTTTTTTITVVETSVEISADTPPPPASASTVTTVAANPEEDLTDYVEKSEEIASINENDTEQMEEIIYSQTDEPAVETKEEDPTLKDEEEEEENESDDEKLSLLNESNINVQEDAVEQFLSSACLKDGFNEDSIVMTSNVKNRIVDFKSDNLLDYDDNEEEVMEKKVYPKRKLSLAMILKKRSIKFLNKMQVMDEAREGCDDVQPSSPGHADQRAVIVDEAAKENGEPTSSIATNETAKDEEDEAEEEEKEEAPPSMEETETKSSIPAATMTSNEDDEQDEDAKKTNNDEDATQEDDCDRSQRHAIDEETSNDSSVPSSTKRKQTDAVVEQTASGGAKKMKTDIENNFGMRDKIFHQYLESTGCGTSLDQIHLQTEQLVAEVRTLNELAKEKEKEWNNIIHMKKMKEEFLLRLQRRKQVMMLMKDDGDESMLMMGDYHHHHHHDDRQQSVLKTKLNNNHHHHNAGQKSASGLGGKSHMKRNYYGGKSYHNPMANHQDLNGSQQQNRQRNVVDVQSIIADYRQRHPETVPRRGRRIRSALNAGAGGLENGGGSGNGKMGILNFANLALGSGSQVRQNVGQTASSSVNDPSGNNEMGLMINPMDGLKGVVSGSEFYGRRSRHDVSFKEMLVQCAKLSQTATERHHHHHHHQDPSKSGGGFPEVTVHPVATTPSSSPQPSNSLLHGILTKSQSKSDGGKTTFSPTLARLLTAPERTSVATNAVIMNNPNVSISDILSCSKARNEITITPVGNQYESVLKAKNTDEEEADDSVDRLVIDEGNEAIDARTRTDTSSDAGDEVPQCQGCNQKAAQFVCAGCGNQWYCSRDCQVAAWDEHSEVCSG